MKTKKLFVYVLISLFVFSPFLNFESWAIGTRVPIMKALPETGAAETRCDWTCQTYNGPQVFTCCYKYCTDDNGRAWHEVDSFCFADPMSNLK
jgi:hypothetical protein